MFEFKTSTRGVPIQRRHILRAAADTTAAFVLFTGVAAVFACPPSSASPHVMKVVPAAGSSMVITGAVTPAERPAVVKVAGSTTSFSAAPAAPTRPAEQAWLLLAVSFSLLAALNLAFVRHLRRAYAPKRQSGRRGMR